MDPEVEVEREDRAHRFIREWGKMVLVVGTFPLLFLATFFMYLQFPIFALVIFAVVILVWAWLLTVPNRLRSSFGGKRNRQ